MWPMAAFAQKTWIAAFLRESCDKESAMVPYPIQNEDPKIFIPKTK